MRSQQFLRLTPKAMGNNWSRFPEAVAAIPQSLPTLKSVTDMSGKSIRMTGANAACAQNILWDLTAGAAHFRRH